MNWIKEALDVSEKVNEKLWNTTCNKTFNMVTTFLWYAGMS